MKVSGGPANSIALPSKQVFVVDLNRRKKAGLPEPAGAEAVFLVRLRLLLYCKYFIFTGPVPN